MLKYAAKQELISCSVTVTVVGYYFVEEKNPRDDMTNNKEMVILAIRNSCQSASKPTHST